MKYNIELLKKSPYHDQSGTAQEFFAELQGREKEVPNLISPHLGNRVAKRWTVEPETGTQQTANATAAASATTPAKAAKTNVALPLGGRIKVEPWNDRLVMLKAKPEGAVAEYEKMPFAVTPFLIYLTRQNGNRAASDSAALRSDDNAASSIGKP